MMPEDEGLYGSDDDADDGDDDAEDGDDDDADGVDEDDAPLAMLEQDDDEDDDDGVMGSDDLLASLRCASSIRSASFRASASSPRASHAPHGATSPDYAASLLGAASPPGRLARPRTPPDRRASPVFFRASTAPTTAESDEAHAATTGGEGLGREGRRSGDNARPRVVADAALQRRPSRRSQDRRCAFFSVCFGDSTG
jgi:hypothetical protein